MHRWGPLVTLAAWLAVAAGLVLGLGAAPLAACLVGFVWGIYAWTLWGYPLARRFHFRRQAGRNFWLGPAFLLVVLGALAVPFAVGLRFERAVVVFLGVLGSLLAVWTIAGLMAHTDGLIDHDWR